LHSEAELEAISEELIEERIKSVTLKPDPGEVQQPDNIFVGKQGYYYRLESGCYMTNTSYK
jgi:hypothetical protein